MRKLERTVSELKARIADEARQPKAPAERILTTAEQSLLKKIRELQADLEVIDRQLSVNSTEEARLKSVIATYQQKVETTPKRESELVELTRDYDILKKNVRQLADQAGGLEARCQSRATADRRAVQDSRPCATASQAVESGAEAGVLVFRCFDWPRAWAAVDGPLSFATRASRAKARLLGFWICQCLRLFR